MTRAPRPSSFVACLSGVLLLATMAAAQQRPSVIKAVQVQSPTTEPSPQVKSAVDGVLDLFRDAHVVAIGDEHGLAQEEAFYSTLVRDPRFAAEVGNVVVEFGGSAAQTALDRFVNGENVPFLELRHVWTDLVGWAPGTFALGYINFFANVRAANLKLAPDQRIKVWLGEPKVDWTQIRSEQDIQPYFIRRDDTILNIISDEILKKQKKTLLIIGSAHLSAPMMFPPEGPRSTSARIEDAAPHLLAMVSPFTGYIEPECNTNVIGRSKGGPCPRLSDPFREVG